MNRKKGKHSTLCAKQNEAHFKNEFKSKVLAIAKKVSKGDSYKLLTSDMLDIIYNFRLRSLKVVADDNVNLPAPVIKNIKDAFFYRMHNWDFQLQEADCKILLYDAMTAGITLWMYLCYIKKNKSGEYPDLVQAFNDFIETEEMFIDGLKCLLHYSNFIAWYYSSFDEKFYIFKIALKTESSEPLIQYPEVRISCYDHQSINVTIDGIKRPAFRVGFTNNGEGMKWVYINYEDIGISGLPHSGKMPVYIQHHAMNRLNERLDCVQNSGLLISLVDSIQFKKKIVHYRGRCLMEYYYGEKKIGYFVIDIIKERIAIIRTFLFLTHSNTPEGDILHDLIGFEKSDIQYLNLDKLSTFANSGLKNNNRVVDLFSKAGCQSLLSLKLTDFETEGMEKRESMILSFLSKYDEYMNTQEDEVIEQSE